MTVKLNTIVCEYLLKDVLNCDSDTRSKDLEVSFSIYFIMSWTGLRTADAEQLVLNLDSALHIDVQFL